MTKVSKETLVEAFKVVDKPSFKLAFVYALDASTWCSPTCMINMHDFNSHKCESSTQ